ncbi:MAG: ring-opening amidohydrolase [Rhodomicrobium sp.]
MRGQQVSVFRISMRGPGDTQGLIRLIEDGELDPSTIVAILGKTEGNGGVNDFTREYAAWSLSAALAPHLGLAPMDVEQRIAFVMSGGTEGVLSPHITVFARKPAIASPTKDKRLSIGIAMTRPFQPEEIGRAAQVEETARAVHTAMEDASITAKGDVHFVQIKCPLLTQERIEAAHLRGRSTVTKGSYASMGYSRAASALGIALALEEIKGPIPDEAIAKDWSLYSSVASASAGIELLRSVVIVFGNSAAASSPYVMGHAVMRDAIDLKGVLEAFASTGIDPMAQSGAQYGTVNVFAKAEASPDGLIRGSRHTMLDDTDISSTRHARAAVGGLIAGVAGTGAVYVSGGAEHQGPPGGGPIAVIVSTA